MAIPPSHPSARIVFLLSDCESPARILPLQFKAIKPVGDRVLVKVDKEDMKSIGGVLLPSSASKKPTAGQIVSVGDVTLVKVTRRPRAIGAITVQLRGLSDPPKLR